MSLVKKRESAKNKQTKKTVKKLHYTGCFEERAHIRADNAVILYLSTLYWQHIKVEDTFSRIQHY